MAFYSSAAASGQARMWFYMVLSISATRHQTNRVSVAPEPRIRYVSLILGSRQGVVLHYERNSCFLIMSIILLARRGAESETTPKFWIRKPQKLCVTILANRVPWYVCSTLCISSLVNAFSASSGGCGRFAWTMCVPRSGGNPNPWQTEYAILTDHLHQRVRCRYTLHHIACLIIGMENYP